MSEPTRLRESAISHDAFPRIHVWFDVCRRAVIRLGAVARMGV